MLKKSKIERDIRVPFEYALGIVRGKWSHRVIGALGQGRCMRYSELKSEITGISDTALAATLRNLVASGMVARSSGEGGGIYMLTQKAEDLIPVMRSMCAWAVRYYPEVTASALPKCRDCPICRRVPT